MLFRKHILSTRTLLQLAVTVGLLVCGVGAALAANSGNPPLLVPYTINVVAGNNQIPTTGTGFLTGFAGEGGPAVSSPGKVGATFSGPTTLAVDSVGNIYITDTNNDLIREVNAQTGLITTVGGKVPSGCSGLTCALHYQGCADGVPASGNAIGYKFNGIAVDSFGNVYFTDSGTLTASVIYRGGAQLAALIALEDPTGVASSGGSPQSGYVYRLAGTVDPTSCKGSGGNTDKVLATSATLNTAGFISLDSAGNIYIADNGNATVRVINAQSTPQTFFQTTVQPGFMASITNCNPALTVACPSGVTTSTTYNGINGPVNAIVFNSQYKNATVDAYGNVYQLNGTGGGTGAPGIYAAAAYAGGAPLANLIAAETPMVASNYGTSTPGSSPSVTFPLGYGHSYDVINNLALGSSLPGLYADGYPMQSSNMDIRPATLRPDAFGTFWFQDTHYPELERIDQYTSLATNMIYYKRQALNGANGNYKPISPINNALPTFTNPYYCVYGDTGANIPWTTGPITYDPLGDGCPSTVAAEGGNIASGPDLAFDGVGDVYIPDTPNNLMREMQVGTSFPSTAVGVSSPVVQAIQIHFSSNNPPKLTGTQYPAGLDTATSTSTSFSIAPGSTDFSIDTTTPEFPMGSLITAGMNAYANSSKTQSFSMYAGIPTCTQLGVFPSPVAGPSDTDWDCLVYVDFNPAAPGMRQGQLTVTTANGSVYNFPLSGTGTGGQLAIDGGTPTVVSIPGLGTPASIAVNSAGTLYVADSENSKVLVVPAGGGTQTTIGTGLSKPAGVAVDSANNVYISDTGNNRVLKVDPNTNLQTVLGNNVWAQAPGATAVPQYSFSSPQGLAVDTWNNVYVADTGNKAVVEIPSNIALGGASPLLSYANAPGFGNPVQVSVDSKGNIYIADTKNSTSQVVELPPGGGDLVNLPGRQFANVRGNSLKSPSAVAVDAAGNVYIADASTNTVLEFPSGSGPGSEPVTLNLPGLNNPTSLALDPSGNLYIADAGNKRVLFVNRQNPVVDFGTVPQALTNPTATTLTVTNIGTDPVPLVSPFASVTSTNPSGNTAFTVTNNSCTGTKLGPGLSCTLTATFNPTTNGPQGENIGVNGTSQSIELMANGEQPLANVVLSATYSSGTSPTAGATATITATVTQPHITGVVPAGTVTFKYAIDANVPQAYASNYASCGSGGTQTVTLNGSGVATFNLPTLAQGLNYTINATYNSTDTLNSDASATPLVLQVPGIQETATASSVSFTYGQPVPALTGTVTPAPASPTTYTFATNATSSTAVGTYPIQVYFSGGNSCAYGFPTVLTSAGQPAIVTEKPAALSYTIANITTTYGAAPVSYGLTGVLAGKVNGDTFSATFTPANSQVLNTGSYPLVPTVTGANIGNYTVSAPPATLTVTPAQTGITLVAAQTAVLNTASDVASATFNVVVTTQVPNGIGIPTGTVTVTDNFTPITAGAPGTGTPAAPTTQVLTLDAGGSASFTPDATLPIPVGTHHYSISYSGDSNFQCSVLGQAATKTCTTSGTTAATLLVDNPDFTVTSTTSTIQIVPGTTPSGNGLPAASGQNSSIPESAIITLTPVLGFSGQVNITCTPQNPSYVTCSMTPPTETISGSATASVLAVSTPKTLPLGFFNSAQVGTSATKTVLAFLPFGVLAFCVRRRRRLSRVLWMLIAFAAVGSAMQGCGGNQVNLYTPVPTGPQTVTVTVSYPGSSTIPAETRSLDVPININ